MYTKPTNSLHIAEKPAWRDEPGFSPKAARFLAAVLSRLDSPNPRLDDLASLFTGASSHMRHSISRRQHMQLFYVSSKLAWALGACAPAVANAEEALYDAEKLGDWEARAELGYLHGMANSVLFNYAEAADYFELSLDSLIAFTERDRFDAHKLKLEAEIFAALAISKLMQADLDAAAKCAESCLRLAKQLPNQPILQAKAEWRAALVYRWRGQPDLALNHMTRADELFRPFRTNDALRSFGRLQAEIADVLLDAADAALARPGGAGPAMRLVARARLRLDEAQRSAQAASDVIGKDLITLTRARYERAAGSTINHVPAIEVVFKGARASGEITVQAQAYTALGRELMAQKERESALNCHRNAVKLVENSEISALMKWSRDALIKEFHRPDL